MDLFNVLFVLLNWFILDLNGFGGERIGGFLWTFNFDLTLSLLLKILICGCF